MNGNGLIHERFDAYKASIDFLVIAEEVASHLPKGRSYLADQLRRAATSIALNIAEGAGEFAPADKARFYRIARRSATECAAVLDVCRRLELGVVGRLTAGKAVLERIVAMLTALVLRVSGRGAGTGAGSGAGTGRGAGAGGGDEG